MGWLVECKTEGSWVWNQKPIKKGWFLGL